MCPAISQSSYIRCALLVLLTAIVPRVVGAPDDEVVEQYLRQNRMDTLLEVQLEERLDHAQSDDEREALGEELSALYLRQLRELDSSDPYRQLTLNRARALISRLNQAPLYELRLELLITEFGAHEQDIELHRLGLLTQDRNQVARQSMVDAGRGFGRIVASINPELSRLDRRRAQPLGADESERVNDQIELLRRHRSLASYYLGWSDYSVAVLDNSHVGDDAYIAFGRLLGADGGMPQSKDLTRAALEYEHVARSAIGVAMCYAQSESASLALAWIDALLSSEDLQTEARIAAQSRKLQILAGSGEWLMANAYARAMLQDRGDDAKLSVPDARFISMKALDEGTRNSRSRNGTDDADSLARFGLGQLVELGEIGHIVDLYTRYGSLPLLSQGFIPNYAQALGALNTAESGGQNPGYLAIAELFSQALKSRDATEYPKHKEDCTLKFAYALIRGDRPLDAVEPCQRVIDTTLNPESKQEARWLIINAFDRINVLENHASSEELDQAVRAYVEAYPSTPRTAKLILRHAMRGTIDDTVAIDTLSAVDESDPIAIPARRTLVRLLYKRLRAMGFSDQRLMLDTRRHISWLINQPSSSEDNDAARANLDILRLGVDLALRSIPADINGAESMIEQAVSLLEYAPEPSTIESELAYQRIQIALLQKRHDQAVAMIDPLRQIDEQRANEAQVLVLNELIELWSNRKESRLAGFIVQLGSPVLARVTPKSPAMIGLQTSALIETVSHAAKLLADTTGEQSHLDLAARLAGQVLERGQPSEAGLRRAAQIASERKDDTTLLDVWLRLLAAYPTDDDRWFEARYESLVVMVRIDPARARQTYEQFRVLNPGLGPQPWNEQIAQLFAESVGNDP